MNPVKFLGILCMCFGVATMLLGTAMVPVAAPVWGDVLEDNPNPGGGGGAGPKCPDAACKINCGHWQKGDTGAFACGVWNWSDELQKQVWTAGSCWTNPTGLQPACTFCTGLCTNQVDPTGKHVFCQCQDL